MPPVLRKRKAPAPPPAPAPAKKKAAQAKPTAKAKEVAKKASAKAAPKATKTNGTAKAAGPPAKGDTITLEGFGGEVETNDGKKTTLQALVDESKSGVVLFTYPKASTPGCTKQVCFFRDEYEPLTKTGLLIYGLSADSAKANTTFKEKQKLTYPLLCDTQRTLITAIGLKKQPNGTQRGVFVVDKSGKVLAAQAGSPQGTVDVVKAIIDEAGDDKVEEPVENGDGEEKEEEEEEAKADEKAEDEAPKK
ncbi:hypothetical protein MKZ38_001525 [Zalerion maritima]|uniref:thioredoxin-dependent peroxiredoxin n=1 Tax=Zalerion maritima TaxID=339359 RepID=A0AAD5WRW0_9PEZI|nr:hypothetical protein MKZ38_001525 [Zalerion maritima]